MMTTTFDSTKIGAAIKSNRLLLGVSQAELGMRAGLSREFLSLIEHGRRVPSIVTMSKLAACFDKTTSDLLKEMDDSDERLELALRLRELVSSGSVEHLRELVEFAQRLEGDGREDQV